MDRDSITRTGARAPGVERLGPLARRCLTRASALTQSREYTVKAVGTKDEGKPVVGQASSDIPALKPYWGKPAVRNFRGGDGNVGIIRSPVRAIALPDCVCAFCGPEKKVNRVVLTADQPASSPTTSEPTLSSTRSVLTVCLITGQ